MLDSAVIEKFNEFKKETEKYQDFDIEKIEFSKVYFFQDTDNITLIGSKKLGNHKDIEYINDENGLPVYDASVNVLTYINEIKYPHLVFEVNDNNNPDISFASEGNSSAGTNFIIHENKYFVNNHRTVMKFSNKYYSKYVYYRIFNMKKEFGFKRGYIPSQSELQKLDITIQLPKDFNENYDSFTIQRIIVEFLEYQRERTTQLRKKMIFLQEKVSKIDKVILSKIFELQDPFLKSQFDHFCILKGYELRAKDIIYDSNIQLDTLAEFQGGNGDYTTKYILENPGKFPLMTGSLEIKNYIQAMSTNDIISIESVSYNKDNDAGSKAFYHNSPYILGGHHYGVFIKEEKKHELLVKYLYYCMQNIFDHNKFYQSKKPVANSSLIKTFSINIPRNKDGLSKQKQAIIVQYIEAYETWKNKIVDLTNAIEKKSIKIDEVFLNKLFKGLSDDN